MLTHHILLYFLSLLSRHLFSSLVSYREGDRGSRVTLVGLAVNVLLTSAKCAAGWYMNSAALLVGAGHSLSGKHALQPAALF
jgi:Co/Zn/Cd efflux system component